MKLAICAGLVSLSLLLGQDQPAPDNTKSNKNDRVKGAISAGQQKMNAADRELTQKIRKSVYQDKTLSVSAHTSRLSPRMAW